MVVPVTDNGAVLIADDDAATLPNMAVFGGSDHLFPDLPLETLRIIAYLQEASSLQGDASVFTGDRRIIGSRLIALHNF